MMKLLFRPIDAAILIYFRIIAGILFAQELVNQLLMGKFDEYMFFEWFRPWSFWGMAVHYSVTIFAAMAVAFNYRYRFFSILLFIGYTSLFLMKASFYNNHTYLHCLLTFWMMLLPLDKNKLSVPAWTLYLILFHMSLVYFVGGITKLSGDWPSDAFSYGGLFFDLLIVPLMIWKPTRKMGLSISILFHLSNIIVFGPSNFPWFSLLLTTMFFDPSWPRKIPVFRRFLPWRVERVQEYEPNQFIGTALLFYVVIHIALPFRHFM